MAEAGPAAPAEGRVERRRLAEARLLHDVARLRRRLHRQRAALAALRVASGLVAALVLVQSLSLPVGYSLQAGAALAAIALTLAVAARRPGEAEVARLVDRRLGLQARVATALELVAARAEGDVAGWQILDASLRLSTVEPRAAFPLELPRRDRQCLAALALVVAAAVGVDALLTVSPLDRAPWSVAARGQPPNAQQADRPVNGISDIASAAGREGRVQPVAEAAAIRPAVGELPPRVGPETVWQETPLDRVAHALSDIAATQDVSAGLQRGDDSATSAALANLADQYQRLSPRAREDIAGALQRAADDVADGDPALARSLQAASQALLGGDGQAVRSALAKLSEALARARDEAAGDAELPTPAAGAQDPRRDSGGRGGRPGPGPGTSSRGGPGPGAGGATERAADLAGSGGAGQRVVDPLSGQPEPLADVARKALGVSGAAGPVAPRVVGVEESAPAGSGSDLAAAIVGQTGLAPGIASASQYVPWEMKSLVREYFSWDHTRAGGQ